jgi:hypothetical protein
MSPSEPLRTNPLVTARGLPAYTTMSEYTHHPTDIADTPAYQPNPPTEPSTNADGSQSDEGVYTLPLRTSRRQARRAAGDGPSITTGAATLVGSLLALIAGAILALSLASHSGSPHTRAQPEPLPARRQTSPRARHAIKHHRIHHPPREHPPRQRPRRTQATPPVIRAPRTVTHSDSSGDRQTPGGPFSP